MLHVFHHPVLLAGAFFFAGAAFAGIGGGGAFGFAGIGGGGAFGGGHSPFDGEGFAGGGGGGGFGEGHFALGGGSLFFSVKKGDVAFAAFSGIGRISKKSDGRNKKKA